MWEISFCCFCIVYCLVYNLVSFFIPASPGRLRATKCFYRVNNFEFDDDNRVIGECDPNISNTFVFLLWVNVVFVLDEEVVLMLLIFDKPENLIRECLFRVVNSFLHVTGFIEQTEVSYECRSRKGA